MPKGQTSPTLLHFMASPALQISPHKLLGRLRVWHGLLCLCCLQLYLSGMGNAQPLHRFLLSLPPPRPRRSSPSMLSLCAQGLLWRMPPGPCVLCPGVLVLFPLSDSIVLKSLTQGSSLTSLWPRLTDRHWEHPLWDVLAAAWDLCLGRHSKQLRLRSGAGLHQSGGRR